MKAIIIAGGKGERLRPLTDKLPKPMIKIGGKPILEHVIGLLKKNGISDLVISLCFLPQLISDYFEDGSRFDVKITYIYEDPKNPSGTSGSILASKSFIFDDFIVTYADIIRDLDIKKMIKFHKNSKSFSTINVYKHIGENFKSSLKFNNNFRLTEFTEHESKRNLNSKNQWSNGSFYIFKKGIFDFIPKNKKSDFSKDIFPKLLRLNKKISVYPSSDYFLDIGTKESLKKARKI